MINKISIIGAGGVGSSLAFSILNRIPLNELALIDVCEGLAQGVALDLEDTRGILGFSTKIKGSDKYGHIKDSDIIVITAGIARKEGMTRLDLLKINANIGKQLSCKVKEFAPSSIIIVVTNPLDFITYVVVTETKFSRNKVLGMGASLDTSRLFNLIYNTTHISTSSLDGFIYGMHSKDMIVEPNRIKIKGENLYKFIAENKFHEIKEKVQGRGAEIVKFLKKGSARFAPAAACLALIETIAYDKKDIIPVSILLNGEYGLKNMCLGVPCIINKDGVDKIIEIETTPAEKKELQKAQKLFEECMI